MICTRCSVDRPEAEFYVHKRTGRPQTVCKICQRARAAELGKARREAAVDPASYKTCHACRQTKPGQDFARDPRRHDGLRAACRPCSARAKWLERYGLNHETYENLMIEQDGVCAICKKPPTNDQRLHVDHCHDSDKVRGLLCGNCNRGVGMFFDDPARIRAAAAYVEGAWA